MDVSECLIEMHWEKEEKVNKPSVKIQKFWIDMQTGLFTLAKEVIESSEKTCHALQIFRTIYSSLFSNMAWQTVFVFNENI